MFLTNKFILSIKLHRSQLRNQIKHLIYETQIQTQNVEWFVLEIGMVPIRHLRPTCILEAKIGLYFQPRNQTKKKKIEYFHECLQLKHCNTVLKIHSDFT